MKDYVIFAKILEKIIVVEGLELLREAKAKYDMYDPEDWTRVYFDKITGGYVVYHREHNFSKKGGGGDAEKTVGEMLAKNNGKQVEFLPERAYCKSPDLKFDNQTWDIKLIDNANEGTIRKAIRDARKAENAIFYWNENDKLDELENAITREVGKFTKENRINELPDIYYMDKRRLLKSIYIKQKGAK